MSRLRRSIYLTERQIHIVSFAINHAIFALFEQEDCEILNDIKKMAAFEKSLRLASKIWAERVAEEKKRQKKIESWRIKKGYL